MGTPGDKAGSIKEVVNTESEPAHQVPASHHQASRTPLFSSPTQSVPVQPIFSTSEQSSGSEMGVIDRLPLFVTLPTHLVTKPDAFRQAELDQSKIEHYYVQKKHYPDYQQPSTSYPLATKSKIFLSSSDQPGPSGLQTPKSKPLASSVSPGRLKRVRKPSAQEQQVTPQTRKTYQCLICKKSFTTTDKLDKHTQTHTGSSPFKCSDCSKTFTSKFKLVRHALIHSDRKPFSCTVCDRTFHRKDHLKNHIKVHSPQKDVYICENCKKQYTSQLSYRKHLALHAAEEGNLTCQICHETFDSKDKILYHLKIHAGSRAVKNPNEKKFKCEECGRRFFTRKDVRRHNVVHTGMRDFLCQYCPQRFGRKDHLVRHIKKSHNTKFKVEETITTATIKTEPKDTSQIAEVPIKTEFPLKSEFPEGSLSNPPETFPTSDLGLPLIEGDLTPFLETDNLLTSEQEALKDLGSTILEDIECTPTTSGILITEDIDASQGVLDEELIIIDNPELLLLESGDKNLPLPGFSQTFQSPPPPGPPK